MWGALYPGQGSQHIGMGKFLFENFKSVKELFEEASDTLSHDFKKLCFEGPEADLNLTANTQPALLLTSVSTYTALNEVSSVKFTAAAGHSIGEYAAVVNSGALKFSDAIMAVRKRGEFMQEAVPVGDGSMIAVLGLAPEQVRQLCTWAMEKTGLSPLEPANYNSPDQTVISGSAKLCNWLIENVDKTIFNPEPRRMKLIPLKVSAPFHCSMMKPAEDKMKLILESLNWNNAEHPIIQNFSANLETESKSLCSNLISQVSGSVRWVECMGKFEEQNITQFIELGAGKVLAGLNKKINKDNFKTLNINSIEDLKSLENL